MLLPALEMAGYVFKVILKYRTGYGGDEIELVNTYRRRLETKPSLQHIWMRVIAAMVIPFLALIV
jgi:hypothetical protein